MTHRRRPGAVPIALRLVLSALLATTLGVTIDAPRALAASGAPHWSIVSESEPTNFTAGATTDAYVLIIRNDGAEKTNRAETVTLSDTLTGVNASAPGIVAKGEGPNGSGSPEYKMTCEAGEEKGSFTCTYGGSEAQAAVLPGAVIVVTIPLEAIPDGSTTVENTATISGGGAPAATVSETTEVTSAPAPFGLSLFNIGAVGEGGEADTQAGSHPFELTAMFAFAVAEREAGGEAGTPLASAAPKDLAVALPPGLLGSPDAVPRCSQQAFLEGETPNCPLDSQVGTVRPFFYGEFHLGFRPVYDVVPPAGALAELGFSSDFGRAVLLVRLRSGGDYGLTASLENLPETGPLQGAILTLWGVPASSRHDLEREGAVGGEGPESETCSPTVEVEEEVEEAKGCPDGAPAVPFLTLPDECADSQLAVPVGDDSWEEPSLKAFPLEGPPPALASPLTGCELLSFAPSLELAPETTQAGAPSGYTAELHIPQNENPSALATPELRSATVSLPAGVTLSPSFANGLQACSHEQFQPPSSETNTAPAACPPASQIGMVKIATPLLASPLEGQVFLGEPACSPCSAADAQEGKLIRLLVQAQGAAARIKLEGTASIDQANGQVTASFPEIPELPFEAIQLTLDGGPNAPLANPAGGCGTPLAASTQLTPYTSGAPAEPTSEPFTLSGCQSPGFQPRFTAGTTNNQAGAFSPLMLALSRGSEEEDVERLSVQLPPGLLAMLSEVYPCPQAQAQAQACTPQSEIGTATIAAGPGADPLVLTGSVYLTGPGAGAPFGLSIVVPATAGPLNLGTLTVGASIEVNPRNAALSIVSEALPQTLDGIPLQIRTIELDINRAGFVFNPTDCQPLAVEGAFTSTTGATHAASLHFQTANCATLAFKPKLAALTHARVGKQGGVHLHVRIVAPAGQANIAKLKLDLPTIMVPRLSTLRKACPASVFDVAPARCPASSVVGSATVLTPVVRQPLSGPVYVLSRGAAASPEIALVLHSEGVTVDVVGSARSHNGVESAAFGSLPDVPFSQLDLLLEAGPHSLLAANLPAKAHGSLCGRRLSMPAEITAQNGAVVKQTTIVSVSGCGKPDAGRRSSGERNVSGRKGRA